MIAFGLIIISCHGVGSSSIIGSTASTSLKRIGNVIDAISGTNFPPWLNNANNHNTRNNTDRCTYNVRFFSVHIIYTKRFTSNALVYTTKSQAFRHFYRINPILCITLISPLVKSLPLATNNIFLYQHQNHPKHQWSDVLCSILPHQNTLIPY